MNERAALIALGFAAAAGAALWSARRSAAHSGSSAVPGIIGAASDSPTLLGRVVSWVTPSKGQRYEMDFDAATRAYMLPDGLLSRMAYQESRYNPAARSPVGAEGLMQFMPATAADFGIDATDPRQSIWAAASYMRQLFDRFGNWKEALAAYNWGQGNVARQGLAKAPQETRDYFTSIMKDTGLG